MLLALFTQVPRIGILGSWALPEELSRRAFLRLRTALLTPHLNNLALLHTEDVDERLLQAIARRGHTQPLSPVVDGALGASHNDLVLFGDHLLYMEANIREGSPALSELMLEVL